METLFRKVSSGKTGILSFVLLVFLVSCHSKKDLTKSSASKNSANVALLSQKLNISEREIKDNKLYSFISEWYGAPYKYGGCDKGGIDCSCFTGLLYQKVYGTNIQRSAASIEKDCRKVKMAHLKEGDFVFFKIGSNNVTHVGVYLRDNKFVHASTSRGVVINDLNEDYYKKYFYHGGKLK